MGLFLVSNMYPSESGLRYGIFVKRFEEAVQEDFEIKLIVLTKKYTLINKVFGYMKLFFGIVRLYFVANGKDVVYVHFPTYVAPLLYPFIWKGIPLVINFHGSDAVPDSFLKKFLIAILGPIVRKCPQVVVPSESYRTKICRMFRVAEVKVFVYPSGGVDAQVFHPLEKGTDNFTIGFVSNFIEQKGWLVFLEALSILNNHYKQVNYEVVMVGDGPDLQKIKEEIARRGLKVNLMEGMNQFELVRIYNSLDVFIFPTYRESLGLVGLEAMMCAVPVIASDVQGPSEYVIDGYNGFLFKKGNGEELASKLYRFYSLSSSEITRMKENCIVTSMKFERNNINRELLRHLNKLTD
ncbi:glycosyltransferase family 1 protein [Euzebyella marina]|uniref:Glycosyltransferase family 1 protein n=1 Tax=Euzebyella marina TaxID=1761453 RepID=A0A3G2L1K8_9FLAO|nr:glycosyltransferase family 4 protein [Euzebyella marina]AYN66096.1 glycosyltransferase family 1 protein [Euzebyella marina]